MRSAPTCSTVGGGGGSSSSTPAEEEEEEAGGREAVFGLVCGSVSLRRASAAIGSAVAREAGAAGKKPSRLCFGVVGVSPADWNGGGGETKQVEQHGGKRAAIRLLGFPGSWPGRMTLF